MEKITIRGKVKEVRTFLSYVTLFITVTSPEKLKGIVKITLNNDSCQYLLKWAQLEIGAEVAITRTQNDDIPRNRTYTYEILSSQVIDMDDV